MQACASNQKQPSITAKFELVNPGDSYKHLLEVYGTGVEEIEPFSQKRLKVISYKSDGAHLREDFYVDPNKMTVILKMQWLNSQLPSSDVDEYVKNNFPNEKFKIYYPCHTFGEQKIFIGMQTHLQLHTIKQKIHTISVGDIEYTNDYIDSLYKKCESIQPPR